MTKEEAFLLLELLHDIDWDTPIKIGSTLGKIRLGQMRLLEKAVAKLEKEC